MANPQKLSSETVARMADELVGALMPTEQIEAVTALLNGLADELAAMRAMDLTDSEPASTYDASPS